MGPFPGPVLFEYTFAGREIPYLPECMTFKNGKLWPNDRKGLGVALDLTKVEKVLEITQAINDRTTYIRPDGSQTNW